MEKLLSNRKSKIAQMLFYLAFIMEIVILCMNNAGVEIPYRGRLLQLAALIFGVKILLTHYTKKEWLWFAFFVAVGILPFCTNRDTLVLQIVFMIFAAKDIKHRDAVKLYFFLNLGAMLLMVFLSAIGVIGNLALVEDFDRWGVETRYAFGYSHPNVFYSNLLIVFAMGIYLFFDKLKGIHYIVLTVLNFGLYILSVSRTGMITVQMVIVLAYIIYRFPQIMNKKYIACLGYVEVIAALAWSIWVVHWPNNITWQFDRIMTGRVGLAQRSAPLNTWTLLPNHIDRGVIDMGYIYLFATMGIMLGIVYLGVMLWFYHKSYQQKNYIGVAVFMTYMVFTMVESHAFSMYFVGNIIYILMLGWNREKKN